jgi:hypothetical protein
MAPATRRAVRDATNLLTATPDEAAIIIACALASAQDLLSLARACRRFAIKCIAAPAAHRSATTAAAAQQAEMWCIAEEVAHRWIASCTDQERGWVPRRGRESWLGLMWEVEVLRRGGAVFGRSHANIMLSEGGSLATRGAHHPCGHFRTAAGKAVLRAGCHYAQFTVVSGVDMLFGVIRPGWDVEGGMDAFLVNGHCFYDTFSGHRYPGGHDWEGMQTTREEGDRIGMLLDLDQGSMTVYKNDERLGVMATGLSGEYSWAVGLCRQTNITRIDATAAPASPTAEELAQAVAYEAAQLAAYEVEEVVAADDY